MEDIESQGKNLEESSWGLLEVGPLTQERRMNDRARPGRMSLGIQQSVDEEPSCLEGRMDMEAQAITRTPVNHRPPLDTNGRVRWDQYMLSNRVITNVNHTSSS